MSEEKKALLIVNPKSGKNRTRANPMSVVDRLSSAGYVFTVRNTTGPGNATEIVKECGPEHDIIVCCGGDGTLNEVINGVMKLDKRIKVGYIPMGSTNDLANTMGIPSDLDKAANLICEGRTNGYDIGMFNNKFYSYIASFGTGVDMSYTTPQVLKNLFGHGGYMFNSFVLKLGHNIRNIKPIHARFEYDGGVIDDHFFLGAVSNSTSVAGIFKFDEDDVKLDDGVFEVLLVRKIKSVADAFAMLGKIARRDYDGDTLIYLKTKSAKFTFDEPVPWTLDGEFGGKVQDVHIDILPKALEIFSTENKMFLGDVAQPTFVREEKEKKRRFFRRDKVEEAPVEVPFDELEKTVVVDEETVEETQQEEKTKRKCFIRKEKDTEEESEATEESAENDNPAQSEKEE